MKEAGVDSLGMHLEVVEPEVRRRILPGKAELSLERYFEAFEQAVAVFGRGEVSTYLLAGLGDSAAAIVACCERLIAGRRVSLCGAVRADQPARRWSTIPPPSTDFMVEIYTAVGRLLAASDLSAAAMAAGCAKCGACSALSLFEQAATESGCRASPRADRLIL